MNSGSDFDHPDDVDEAFQEVKKKQNKLKVLLYDLENLDEEEEERKYCLERIRETELKQKVSVERQTNDFRVILRETPTVSLLQLEPVVFFKGTDEAESVDWYAKAFREYQERKRHVLKVDGTSQTLTPLMLRKGVQTSSLVTKDAGVTATEWDMFDSFRKTEQAREEPGENYSQKFLQASQTCQRVLASNNFRYEQILFNSKHEPGRSFKYNLEILWELKELGSGGVGCIALNPSNAKIIAVGYGDVRSPSDGGTVCFWNAKNPQCPERKVELSSPVTCLSFSRDCPRYLALVTLAGDVILVDVEKHDTAGRLLASSPTVLIDDPLWWVTWYRLKELNNVTERVMTVGQSGLVHLWDPNMKQHIKLAELSYSPTHHDALFTHQLADDVKNIRGCKVEHRDSQFFQTNYQGTAIELDPSDSSSYYVTTNQGAILKVKIRRILGDTLASPAHQGSVLGMRHSPFSPVVFLTHGADSATKIWVKGISNPIVVLKTKTFLPVTVSLWSPSHSTVLLTLSDHELALWDISRSHLDPMFILKSRSDQNDGKVAFRAASFNSTGTILYVGLNDGTVTVYRLVDMPHPPFLQKNHLLRAFKKATYQNDELYEEIEFIIA